MAGCINGIQNIEVKAPNGEPSTLFPMLARRMDINDAYRAYLLSESPTVRESNGFTLQKNGEVVFEELIAALDTLEVAYNFKSGEETTSQTKETRESVINQIIERAKSIVSPEEDAEGNQGDFYGIKDAAGNVVNQFSRVSNFIGNFIYSRGRKAKGEDVSLIDYLVDNKVSRDFKGVPAGETIIHRGKEYTREDYAESIRASYQQGIVKGNIIHAMLELKLSSHAVNSPEYNEIVDKINKYKAMSLRPGNEYDWVLNREVFGAILDNLGINKATPQNKMPKELEDKVYTEVAVANDILKIGGKIDILKEDASGNLQVTDTKTGNNFDRSTLGSRIMRFGSQNGTIYDDSVGRAKLQTMLYSMIIKLNHPTAKLLPPQILHIPSETLAKNPSSVHSVDVNDYLTMIEQYFKSEDPETYKKMIAQSPEIFNPVSYGAATNQKVVDKFTKSDDPGKLLFEKELELQRLQNSVSLRITEFGSLKGGWTTEEKLKREELMRDILQAKSMGVKLPNTIRAEDDIKRFTKWVGTISDTNNPFIHAYAQVVEQSRNKIREEYKGIEEEYDGLLAEVMKERGKDPFTKTSKNFRMVDTPEFFSKYIVNRVTIDSEGLEVIDRGTILPSDAEWKNLTPAEQKWLTFMQDTMKNTFNEVMISGPEAKVGYRNGQVLNKLDVYNLGNRNFQWHDDFIPRVSVTRNEVLFRSKRNFGWESIKNSVSDWVARSFSMYYEEHVDGHFDKNQYGIPVRFLGSGKFQHNPDIHSSDLEHTFKTFMQHYINKKHYDSTYALGDSVRQYMLLEDETNNPTMKNSAEFLEYHMMRNLEGRIREKDSDYVRKGFNIGNKEGVPINFSFLKFGKSAGGFAAAAGLWLKPVSAIKNAVQAFWAVSKHGWTNAIAHEVWPGLNPNFKDTSANVAKINKEWLKMQADFLKNKGEANPIKVFMDTFQLYPDVSEVGGKAKGNLAGVGKILNTKMLSALHGYPEDWTTAMLAVNTMMSLKVQEGKYAGQSMWDIYSNNIVVDPVTGRGSYKLPDDFTRGKIKDGSGQLRDWKGLEPIEVQKIKKVIQSVKGGYRLDERSMIESTALGEMAMIFKRWLPAALIQGLQSKRLDPTMGFFEKVPGEDHYEWRSRVVEGRWRTVGGVIANAIGVSKERGYDMDQLSDLQKKNIIDAGLTVSAMFLFLAVYSTMMDREEKDSIRVLTWETGLRLVEQWNIIEWVNTATSQPMVVKSMTELLKGTTTMSMALGNMAIGGDEEDIYTRRGDLRGVNQVLKNLPATSWYYNGEKFIDEIQD